MQSNLETRLTSAEAETPHVGNAPAALSVSNVRKAFGGTQALKGLSLEIAAGEIRALLGGNGSGKSTLIKILSGYHRQDPGGVVHIGGKALTGGDPRAAHRLGARFVHQDLGLIDDSSVLDNLSLISGFPTRFGTVRGAESRRLVRDALSKLGLDLDPSSLVRELSPAEKTGLAVARALAGSDQTQIRLLVLDEPTATLPSTEVRVLLDMVRVVAESGVGVLYVTHRLDEVFGLASYATILRDGEEVVTTPVAGMTHTDLVHYMVGAEVENVKREAESVKGTTNSPALHVKNLRGSRLSGMSFDVYPGEIVGISGVTGSGRETLAATLFGALDRQEGDVEVGGTFVPRSRPDLAIGAGVAFMPADRKISGGLMEMTAKENITLVRLRDFWKIPYLRRSAEIKETAKWFKLLSVHPSGGHEELLSAFSGGNQQKLLLSKWLRLKPKVLLLDEPTQGVDIAAKAEIHHHLLEAAKAGSAIVVSSSDFDELVALCGRVLVLREGRLSGSLARTELTVQSLTRESLVAHQSWSHAKPQSISVRSA